MKRAADNSYLKKPADMPSNNEVVAHEASTGRSTWSAGGGGGISDAPVDGNEYVRQNAAWVQNTGGSGGVPEAPNDGNPYARQSQGWVVTSLVGPQGPQGPQGDPGADGADGAQGPQGATGPAGADGATGPAGADGADGNTWLSGTVDPTTEGVDGDFYLNTATDQYFGPRTGGVWGSGTDLVGPAGADGADGAQGPQGDTGAQGPAGPAGADGADGQGVPAGGTTGQVLEKASNTDFDTQWGTPSGGGGSSAQILTLRPSASFNPGTTLGAITNWQQDEVRGSDLVLGSGTTVTIGAGLNGEWVEMWVGFEGGGANNRVELELNLRRGGVVQRQTSNYSARNTTQERGAVTLVWAGTVSTGDEFDVQIRRQGANANATTNGTYWICKQVP